MRPGVIFGSSIFLTNVYNYKKSPVYIPNDNTNTLRIVGFSSMTGCLYGLFYPLGIAKIVLDIFPHSYTEAGVNVENHFIPYSTY